MVRFEGLVQSPEATLEGLYAFPGVEMPADATDVSVVSQGFRRGEQGLDAAAASRWREHIHPIAKRLLEILLHGPMRSVGYAK